MYVLEPMNETDTNSSDVNGVGVGNVEAFQLQTNTPWITLYTQQNFPNTSPRGLVAAAVGIPSHACFFYGFVVFFSVKINTFIFLFILSISLVLSLFI